MAYVYSNSQYPSTCHKSDLVSERQYLYTGCRTLRIGELIIYKDKILGSGAFGTAFKGEMKSKPCAVKVLKEIGNKISMNLPTVSHVQDNRLNSFEKELKTLLDLKHPNIVELLHVCPYPQHEWPCLVMELLDCNLQKYLTQNPGCQLSLVVQISLSCNIANGLAFLCKKNIIHRDLCGANILIQKGHIPVAKIADFGLSRIAGPSTMTTLGHRNGYLPPECSSKDYDSSIDIHMFGVTMVQIVHAVENIESPEERYKLIDEIEESHPLKQLIKSCVEIERSKRPKAETAYKELQNLLRIHEHKCYITLDETPV